MIDPIAKAYKTMGAPCVAPKEEKLPILEDGKSDDSPDVEIPPEDSKPLEEQFREREHDAYDHAAYQKEMDHAHAMYDFTGGPSEDHDKVVSEMLKKIPSVETYMTAKKIMDSSPTPIGMNEKYGFVKSAIHQQDEKYKPHENYLTHDEYENHRKDYKFIDGRKIEHKDTGLFFQLHPNGEKTLSTHVYDYPDDDDQRRARNDAHDALNDLHKHHIMKDENSIHVKEYTGDSTEINKHLAHQYNETENTRKNNEKSPEERDAFANDLSRIISSAPVLNRPVDVYSGLSKSTNIHETTMGGTKAIKFHMPTFMSTSLHREVGADFAKIKHHDPQHIADMVHFTVPEGHKGALYVDFASQNSGEKELLLDKGHDIDIHPGFKYLVHQRKVVRQWEGTLHPKKYEK